MKFVFAAVLCALCAAPRNVSAEQPAPLDLAGFVARVLAENPDYAAARMNVEIARAGIAVAKVFPDPELSLGLNQYDLSRHGNPTVAGVGLAVPLELGGKRGARVAVAESGLQVSRHEVQDAARELAAVAENAFIDALHAELVLAEKQRAFESLERLVRVNERRLSAGDIGEAALLASRVEARQFEAEVIAARAEVRTSSQQLLALLGQNPLGGELRVQGDLERSARELDGPELVRRLAGRADLRAAAARVSQSERAVSSERARRVVDVSVSASYQHAFRVASDPESQSAEFVGAALSVPLPFSRVYRGELDAALWGREQARRELGALKVRASAELARALTLFDAASRQVEAYQRGALDDSRSVVEKTLYNYERGGATIVDVLIATRTASDVHLAYAGALADRAHALVELERASGSRGLAQF